RKGVLGSDVNLKRCGAVDRLGLDHARGRAASEKRDEARSRIHSYDSRPRGLDPPSEAAFREHKAAWKFFEAQAPSYRMTASYWVMSAKRDETKVRRLEKLIEHSRKGVRITPFGRPTPRSS